MIAIFPVRANPPHLGHIRAFLKIKDDYDKIIITVSDNTYKGKKLQVMSPEESILILREIFDHIPGYEIIFIKEPFITRKYFDDLPNFDVVVTGNKMIYENMKKQNIPVRFVERIPIYRGEFIREAYLKGKEYESKDK